MTAEHSEEIERLVRDFRAGKVSRRQFLAILAASTAGAALAGRSAVSLASPARRVTQDIKPATLVYGASQDIATVDPSDRMDYSINAISRQIYDRLFRFEGGWPQPVEPGLAQKWEHSDDAKEWTFHITDKAKFHDGTPVTAESVAYSFQRTLRFKKERSSLLIGYLDEKGVVAKDS